MKNNFEEEPKTYFERNVVIIICVACISIVCDYVGFLILNKPSPWGVFVAFPGLVISLQTLWLVVNPFAIVYDNRFEIKQSFFYNKEFYFLDMKQIEFIDKKLIITYNDLDKESLRMFGIRDSHKQRIYESIKQHIELSTKAREF